jgi:hypothetical protein
MYGAVFWVVTPCRWETPRRFGGTHLKSKGFLTDVTQMAASYETRPCKSFMHWYSNFFVRVPPDIISLQLCTPEVVGA